MRTQRPFVSIPRFGCGKGGNVINFVMEMDNLSFPEAIKKLLKEKKNIDLKENELRLTPEEEAKYKKREAMHIINDKLCAFYVSQLDNGTADANAAKSLYAHAQSVECRLLQRTADWLCPQRLDIRGEVRRKGRTEFRLDAADGYLATK
jgi:DNA primase (bacterial type)